MPRVTKKDKTDKVVEEEKVLKSLKKKAETPSTKESEKKTSTKEATAKKVSTKKVDSDKKATAKTTKEAEKEEKKVDKKANAKKNIDKKEKASKKDEKKESKVDKKTKKETKVKASASVPKKRTSINPFKSILSRRRKKKVSTEEDVLSSDDNMNIEADTDLVQKSTVLEYYDLPYRYNQTTVKILAQTPSVLFVYWDIADSDRANFVEKFGENFFDTTRPILLVHNKTKNYSFEVEINDFANSWYLRMQEPDCEYEIELIRRSRNDNSKYIYISSSNSLISPNNHVLFEKTDFQNIKFRNVKTGQITRKDYGSLRLMTNIGELYNQKHKVLKFYRDLYSDEVLESNRMFSNPSSSNPSSRML